MRAMPSFRSLTLLLLAGGLALPAADGDGGSLRGASAALAVLAAPATPAVVDRTGAPGTDEVAALAQDPARTADAWLALVRRAVAAKDRHDGSSADGGALLAALPGPDHWPALRAGLDGLSTDGAKGTVARWRMLGAALVGDDAALIAQFKTLTVQRPGSGWAGNGGLDPWSYGNLVEGVLPWLATESDRRALIDHALTRLGVPLKPVGMSATAARAKAKARDGMSAPRLDLGDLARLLGETETEAVLRRGLLSGAVQLRVSGTRSAAIQRRLVRELVDRLPSAPWGAISSTADAAELYPLLSASAPVPAGRDGMHDWERSQAEALWTAHLILAGRTDEASALLRGPKGHELAGRLRLDWDDIARAGDPGHVLDTLHRALEADPGMPLWGAYISLAAQAGEQARALALVRASVARLPEEAKATAIGLLLAVDDLDTALPILRTRAERPLAAAPAATRPAPAPTDDDSDPFATPDDDDRDERPREILEDAIRLVRLGTALHRADLTEAGLVAARRAMPVLNGWSRDDGIASLADALRHAGRAATGEELVLASFPGDGKDAQRADRLAALVRIYHGAGRLADALALIERAPGWGAKDLAELVAGQGHHDADLPIALIAGEALAAAGRTGPARAAAVAVLAKDPSCDPAYALLARLDGAAAAADLERRAAASPLEERPLVWLARVRLDAGDVAGAAAAAEQAMAMDPSDGDEGPGDRFRARAVLADVRERQGRAEEAATLRTAVASIRAAEQTDRLMEAGLTTRAVVGYQQALSLNANAYCIQSRLARELARLGRHAEAEAHYQRAFEIMPRAFGRRESHCFGCEGAFEGLRAQAIAERVFTGRLAQDPDNPRLHYLLAILRQEQDRHAEAAAGYARALALDKDYYTAARRLLGLAQYTDIPAETLTTAALTMVRLDPARRYAQGERPMLRDLARLWRTYAELPPAPEAAPEQILPLVAPAVAQDPWTTRVYRHDEPAGIPTPAGAVAAQQPLTAIVNNLR